jgi:hypothetical protein
MDGEVGGEGRACVLPECYFMRAQGYSRTAWVLPCMEVISTKSNATEPLLLTLIAAQTNVFPRRSNVLKHHRHDLCSPHVSPGTLQFAKPCREAPFTDFITCQSKSRRQCKGKCVWNPNVSCDGHNAGSQACPVYPSFQGQDFRPNPVQV